MEFLNQEPPARHAAVLGARIASVTEVALVLPQHPDEHRLEDSILLAVSIKSSAKAAHQSGAALDSREPRRRGGLSL
jgi:hypothetical protein